jgi:hypothetical protein
MDYLVEHVDGEFVLPLAGFVCSEMSDSRGGTLILRAPDSADAAWVTGSELDEDRIRTLVERKARVESAVASSDATLRLVFDDGSSLVNPPADEIETWEVTGPGYVLAVGVPGGREPAIWDANSEIRTVQPGDPVPEQVREMARLYGMPEIVGGFEFRPTSAGAEAFELHPPGAPPLNRAEVLRYVMPGRQSANSRGRWWKRRP